MVEPKKSVEDVKKDREAQLKGLITHIEECIFSSETLVDYNTLAMAMLIRSLDILDSCYEEREMLEVVEFIVLDRAEKRRMPTTQEYVAKLKNMRKFLP